MDSCFKGQKKHTKNNLAQKKLLSVHLKHNFYQGNFFYKLLSSGLNDVCIIKFPKVRKVLRVYDLYIVVLSYIRRKICKMLPLQSEFLQDYYQIK